MQAWETYHQHRFSKDSKREFIPVWRNHESSLWNLPLNLQISKPRLRRWCNSPKISSPKSGGAGSWTYVTWPLSSAHPNTPWCIFWEWKMSSLCRNSWTGWLWIPCWHPWYWYQLLCFIHFKTVIMEFLYKILNIVSNLIYINILWKNLISLVCPVFNRFTLLISIDVFCFFFNGGRAG